MAEDHDEFNHAETRVNELRGNTAVVTGSSSGIGKAIALEFAAAGADVLIHAGTNRVAAEGVRDLVTSQGVASRCVLADLADPDAINTLVEKAWTWRDGIDIWVNNAGADVLTGPAANWTFEEKLERLWKVDVVATMRLSRAVGRRMRSRAGAVGSSAILNVGWDQAEFGMEGDAGEMFAAVKGAIIAFTKSLAKSLAPSVRVNCVAPGWIKTAWATSASEYWQRRARAESLLDRWGTPEEVARAARFLVSPGAAFVTGHILPVNGGWRRSDH